MKGLLQIPTTKKLKRAYRLLESGKAREDQVALWSQWSRFDPRLGEILVASVFRQWSELNPLTLNKKIREQPWPAALGVVLEHVNILGMWRQESQAWDSELFRKWLDLVMAGIGPAHHEMFLIGVFSFAEKRMRQESLFATKPYLTWGYLGRDVFINKFSGATLTSLSSERRRLILEKLIAQNGRLTVAEYRRALDFTVSQRQAQLDLQNHDSLKAVGFTRNRHYIRR